MCRLMAFMGQNPILLADVVLWPDRSIIKQVSLETPFKSLNITRASYGHGCTTSTSPAWWRMEQCRCTQVYSVAFTSCHAEL